MRLVDIAPRRECGPCRNANGGIGISRGKAGTAYCQGIDIGGIDKIMTIAASDFLLVLV